MAENLKAYIQGHDIVGQLDGRQIPFAEIVGLAYIPHEPPYKDASGFVNTARDASEEKVVIVSERPQPHDVPRHVRFFYENRHDFSAVQALDKGLVAVKPGEKGLDVRILGETLQTPPQAVSVSHKVDGGRPYTLVVCSYENPVVKESLELDLYIHLPTWKEFSSGKKGRYQGGDLRVLMIENETNIKECFRDRKDIRQTLLVGTPELVDRLHRALSGDESVLPPSEEITS